MTGDRHQRARAIPTGRLNRMARLGGMTTAVAGSMAVRGGLGWLSGRRPGLRDLLLTPSNAARVADHLAHMRGAAMKAGQLLSMETQDMLPPELSELLGRLRAEAHVMPPAQLKQVLIANWGHDFRARFAQFDVRPIAAASIGQVHRARTRDGREVAIKVQYPGIRDSIDSDMRNLGTILRATRLVPESIGLERLLEDARLQLHEEADYRREAEALRRFGRHLEGWEDFVVPQVQDDLSTGEILTMGFVDGVSIETLAGADQETRDRVATRILALMLHELFTLRDMQTDPNFANYRYDPETGRVALLDLGATRRFDAALVQACRGLLRAAVSGARTEAMDRLGEIGVIGPDLSERDRAHLGALFDIASEPFMRGGRFDFGRSDLLARLRRAGLVLAENRASLHAPPTDALFLQRKVLGTYLLAERLRARVDLGGLLAPYL